MADKYILVEIEHPDCDGCVFLTNEYRCAKPLTVPGECSDFTDSKNYIFKFSLKNTLKDL